ncbi:carboxypeptidase-like regulatory domain-containing protein [Ferviditalea candida]|uniref:Carboxypeptidase-like regulatory domain-containing protein n=1 Tax=Ferviditalea candida TaxID=3108399 RepID=A0ABU5ZJT0_9BACL|nr:carboxypeptidase-like regulatory domain-containing protein [Paenibacillaceae bacterium T2]
MDAKASEKPQAVVEFQLDQTFFEAKPWRQDLSHMDTVHGRLRVNGEPVVNAQLEANKHLLETGKDGTFEINLDRSALSKIPVHIKSLEKATISGQPVGKQVQQELMSRTENVYVYYPINIQQVRPSAKDPGRVEVHGRVTVPEDTVFPTIKLDKYAIYGVVKDHAGNPVKNAVVNIRRDGVEGFAKSLPSNDKGEYIMYYIPEGDEEIYLNVYVGNQHYTLPENRVYHFPEGMSIETNITLPKEGTVIQDYPPTLVSKAAPGQLYLGTFIGLSVSDDVAYTVTVPKADGSFIVTLPKTVWDQKPLFYETNMSKFTLKPLSPGDPLPSTEIQKPAPFEPDRIQAKNYK